MSEQADAERERRGACRHIDWVSRLGRGDAPQLLEQGYLDDVRQSVIEGHLSVEDVLHGGWDLLYPVCELDHTLSLQELDELLMLGDVLIDKGHTWRVFVEGKPKDIREGPSLQERLVAANTLGQVIRHKYCMPALLAVLRDESEDVQLRNACVIGLSNIPDRRVVDVLIETLGAETLAIASQAHLQLRVITGHHTEFSLDEHADSPQRQQHVNAWKAWWEKNRDGFKIRLPTESDARTSSEFKPSRSPAHEPTRKADTTSQVNSPRAEDGPLQLRISAPKTTIVQCEPVPVKFELKNVSDRLVIVGDLSFYPGSERVPLEITPPGEKPYVLQRALISSDSSSREIEAHQSVTHGSVLLHNRERGFLFKHPGQYRIKARFDDRPLRLRSNTLVFTVEEAQGVDAKALREHWGCTPVARFMIGGTSDYVIAREFQAILEKYPTSVYAPWCELALVRAQRKRARDDRSLRKQFGAEIFPTLTENAIRDYERFLKTHPDSPFPFPVQMRYEIATMKLDLDRKEAALREIEELFEKHPEVDFLKEAKFKIDLYAKRGREITAAELP